MAVSVNWATVADTCSAFNCAHQNASTISKTRDRRHASLNTTRYDCSIMVQKLPKNDDPTAEEPALEFDGTRTDQLDDTYRFRVVATSENGAVAFDDRGQAQWKWITELGTAVTDSSETFDQLKALDHPALGLEEPAPEVAPEPSRKVGYDPYATGVFPRPKKPR